MRERKPARAKRYPPMDHEGTAKMLRSRPGKWQGVAVRRTQGSAREAIKQISEARHPAYVPSGAFEAEVRWGGDDPEVWARYKGE